MAKGGIRVVRVRTSAAALDFLGLGGAPSVSHGFLVINDSERSSV